MYNVMRGTVYITKLLRNCGEVQKVQLSWCVQGLVIIHYDRKESGNLEHHLLYT